MIDPIIPLHRHKNADSLRRHIVSQILSGGLRAGDALLSEKELSRQFGVSIRGVQTVLAQLVKEGWIYRRRRAGTYVSDSHPATAPGTASEDSAEGKYVALFMPEMLYASDSFRMDYWAELTRPLETYLSEHNVKLVYSPRIDQGLPEYLEHEADRIGVVVMAVWGGHYDLVKRFNLPSVCIISRPDIVLERNDRIEIDDLNSSTEAVRHLTDLGHERIAILTSKPDARNLHPKERLDGYERAMAEAGLSVDPDLVCYTDWSVQGGYEAMLRLLARGNRITALFAGNDRLAFGAMRAIHESRLRIPDDVSVIGFDDWELASHTDPPLTTMRVDRERYGQIAGRLVIERLLDPDRADSVQRFPAGLVVRSSTARLLEKG